jgi:hypothetical protein
LLKNYFSSRKAKLQPLKRAMIVDGLTARPEAAPSQNLLETAFFSKL